MTDLPEPPPRVRVTGPRTDGRVRRHTPASEIDDQSELGEIYMNSLLRAQGRLALTVLGVLAVTVGGLPLLFHVWPTAASTRFIGMPLSWVLLGFAVYPLLWGLGWWYVRAAERNERAFADVVDRP